MSARGENAAKWLWAHLSPYLDKPPLPQSDPEWAAIFETADHGLVLPRLATSLSSKAADCPSHVIDYLDAVLTMSRMRNERMRAQLVTLIKCLNDAGVTPIVIKGATTLLDEAADVGERAMLDIDIWTPHAVDQAIAADRLKQLGYEMREPLESYEDCQHLPPFFKDGELARIELHRKMVNPHFSALVNEDAATASSKESEFGGARFKLLEPRFALALSYIQCRWSCEEGTLTIMKWLDLLDRCKLLGIAEAHSCVDLGVADTGAVIDRRFLTALQRLTGFPYEGVKDAALYDAWLRRNASPVVVRLMKGFMAHAHDPRRWSSKGFAGVAKGVFNRVKRLPEIYRQSKRVDRF